MYGIPEILQGAAQRETLSPEQLARLESQGIPTAGAHVNAASMLPMLAIGAIAAWFIAGGSKRGSVLWTLLVLLLPVTLAAQTPLPYGLNTWTNMNEWCQSPKPFTSTMVGVDPSKALVVLQRAAKCGIRLQAVYPRRLYTTNGASQGPYSPVKHRALSDAYARALPPDTLRKYRDNGTLLGLVTGDDFGCAPCWGGVVIPLTEARDAANYAKRKMPAAPIGVRVDAIRMLAGAPTGWQIDYAIAQWIASPGMLRRYGTPENWFRLNASAGVTLRLVGIYYNINTYHCTGPSTTPPCTPSQVTSYGGAALAQPKTCGFISWRWEPRIWTGAYRLAWERLFQQAKSKTSPRCWR